MTTEGTTGKRDDGDTRQAWREKREAQVQEMAARMDLWEAEAKKAKADARIRYAEELGKLRGKLETARLKLSLLQDTGEVAWDDVKSGVESAMKDLRSAVERASSRFE